jgi:hypothetical protein
VLIGAAGGWLALLALAAAAAWWLALGRRAKPAAAFAELRRFSRPAEENPLPLGLAGRTRAAV